MKGFKMNNGDVVISNGKIEMVDGNELLRQTVKSILQTNKGEWFLNETEGINFRAILKKMPDFDEIRSEVLDGLTQVDETFTLDRFNYEVTERNLAVSFAAHNSSRETVEGAVNYQ